MSTTESARSVDVTLATELARKIRDEQRSLDAELRRPVKERRAARFRELHIARVTGMLIGLSYIIGRPGNTVAAENWVQTALDRPDA